MPHKLQCRKILKYYVINVINDNLERLTSFLEYKADSDVRIPIWKER